MLQPESTLKLRVSCIDIQDLVDTKTLSRRQIVDLFEKIKMFHVFSFCLVYSAQHHFYMRLFQCKYSFYYLFQKLLKLVNKDQALRSFLDRIYSQNEQNYIKQFQTYQLDEIFPDSELETFIIPILKINGKFSLNLDLI